MDLVRQVVNAFQFLIGIINLEIEVINVVELLEFQFLIGIINQN